MAYKQNYIPKFPYAGDQCTISSGRIIFHAKEDSAFIFASKAISLSTSGSTHINSPQGVFINGTTIELGLNAQEPLLKGKSTVNDLRLLYSRLEAFGAAVGSLSTTEPEAAIPGIIQTGQNLAKTVGTLKRRLPTLLSKTSKTL
jgi:hypothetical protein